MIYDRSFDYEELRDFLLKNNEEFMSPLSTTLQRFHTNIDEYSRKLASKATIACQKHGDEICCVIIGYTHDLPDDHGSFITQVMTDPKYRCRGIATGLLYEYLEYCKGTNVSYVWLTTESNNYRAQRVYEGVGFHQTRSDTPGVLRYEYSLKK